MSIRVSSRAILIFFERSIRESPAFENGRDGLLGIWAKDWSLVEPYRFGSRTADFLICRRCGVYIGAVCETEAGARAVINVNCLDDRAAFSQQPTPVDHDDEATVNRLARRAVNWTPANIPLRRIIAGLLPRLVGDDYVKRDLLPSMAAEHFAWFLEKRPGAYIWIGNGNAEGAAMLHNPHHFNDAILSLRASYWVRLAESVLSKDYVAVGRP
jgi:hypothetical protein